MNNLRHGFSLMLMLGLILAAIPTGVGQSPSERHPDQLKEDAWVLEVPCRGNEEREGIGFIKEREFRLCFDFNEFELQPKPGVEANWVPLTIVSYTKGTGQNLTDIKLSADHPEYHPGLTIDNRTVEMVGPQRPFGNLTSKQEFRCKIGIADYAKSDRYPLEVAITSGEDIAAQKVSFKLPILTPDPNLVSVQKKSPAVIDCWTGSQCAPLQLQLLNTIPYHLIVNNISITSDDLLEDKLDEDLLDNARSLDIGSTPRDVTLKLKAKPMTVPRLFSGIGKSQVTMRFDYKDDYGRTFPSKEISFDLQIRPNVAILAIFLILGAVVGTLVRIDLRRMKRAGLITKTQYAIFAATTFASGILVCLIALFANIKLVVLNEQNYSAWDPKVLFLTALIATVSGLPILYAYLKLPPKQDAKSQPKALPHKKAKGGNVKKGN